MEARQVIRDLFPGSERTLRVGGFSVEQVAEQFGTPLFVYDESVLRRKWALLRSTFPSRFDIHYSVKANPNPNILAFFFEQGAGLEIASVGELHQALEAGCPAQRMLFAGPGKSPAELETALSMNVGEIHAESLTELGRIAAIAERLGKVAPVALRINPASEAQGGAMRMGGKATPFGIDEESLESALDLVLASRSIELRGMHLFAGTQILDTEVLLCQYRKAIQLARRIAERQQQALCSVDFGGGLGVPYFGGDQPLDMHALKNGLEQLVSEIADDPLFAGTRFIIEPGRFLVAEAGVYLTRVLDVKISRGKTFVIVDGGMNHHLAASGNLGQTIKRNFPVTIANRLQESESETVDIVGPLCTPLDVLARSVAAPRIEAGDLVAILHSGAYARSASPLGFLSHPSPAEVLVADHELRLIRRRGSPSDYLRDVETAYISAAANGVRRA
jgi:diaminopimelate decarboxylase